MSAEEATSPVDASTSAAEVPASTEKPKSASPSKKPPSSKPRGRPSTGGAAGASKKASAPPTNDDKSTFDNGDIVLARLRGYPPWPARIVDPDTLPRNVLKQRPGKNPSIYCCQFFPVGDFSWLQSKEIKPLTSSEISSYLNESHRKGSGALKSAYETAKDPREWDRKQANIQQAQEDAENEVDVDELEDEEDEEDEENNTGGKRKRAAPEKKKAGKKAKTTKSKAEVEDEDEAPKSKAKAKPAAKAKASTAKGGKPPVSKPENQEPADDDPLASNPECIKVKDWRHKLQRAFLSKSLPSAEEMPTYDDMFKTIENHDGITIEALTYSKIGKVMKKIMTLTEIPRNEEFKITDRAAKLMHQWTDFIAVHENKANGNGEASTSGEKKEEIVDTKAPEEEEKKDEEKPVEEEKVEEKEEETKDGEKIEVDA